MEESLNYGYDATAAKMQAHMQAHMQAAHSMRPMDSDQRPLETLASAAQRVNSAVVRVGCFIDRFNGAKPEPVSPGAGSALNTINTPHRDTIDRLFAAIDRLENRLDALDSIG